MSRDLRVAVAGAGLMGADHIARITRRISGAVVSAIIEPDPTRATAASVSAPSALICNAIEEAIAAHAADAVLVATPGKFHVPILLQALEAKLPVLCEKPLTPDSASAWSVLQREQQLERPHIQVGLMRRFDAEYVALRELIASGEAGHLMMLRGVHRNPVVPDSYTQEMLINDSLVHEFGVLPWLAGSSVKTVEVKYPRRNALSQAHLREPILVLMELDNGVLVDVEMNVSAQFGYQVATEAVFERGLAPIPFS